MTIAIEDILNQALRRLGNEPPIGYIFEGSKASRAGLEIYGQTRDAFLRVKDWSFARRDTAAIPNGQTAPQPWNYEFMWPADCLKVRYVMPGSPGLFPVLDPRPIQFTDFNDNRFMPAQKAILTTITPATLIYTGQVTDPNVWDADFTEALVEGLARRLAVAITGSADLMNAEAQAEAQAVGAALQSQVNQPPLPALPQGARR